MVSSWEWLRKTAGKLAVGMGPMSQATLPSRVPGQPLTHRRHYGVKSVYGSLDFQRTLRQHKDVLNRLEAFVVESRPTTAATIARAESEVVAINSFIDHTRRHGASVTAKRIVSKHLQCLDTAEL